MQKYREQMKTVPGAYIALIADVISHWGVSVDELLLGTGVQKEQLLQQFWQVDFGVSLEIIDKALSLTREPKIGFGFYLGLQMTVTCHGLIGFAAMVAKDIRGALKIAQEFISLQSNIHSLQLEIEGDSAHFYFRQTERYRNDEVIQVALLMGFVRMGSILSGKELTGYADVCFERPEYFDKYLHLIPGEIRFGKNETKLVFNKDILDFPLLTADPIMEKLIRDECRLELQKLKETNNDFKSILKNNIFNEKSGFLTATEVCKKLNISERTLQRKLLQEGTNFRELIDQMRCAKALALLKNRNLSLKFIANQLGYSDVRNFTRAFKRWTGKTPRQIE
ncbi:AraC family transcriptional regulator [Acinetobacter pittii]|uniref:AraC family transcriptional regulator n=3 Tax=Acinetobacter TaxID=469 RepID=UPI00148E3D36|nr:MULTISPECIES: AraC family transcriptional regulator [Acinetobacter calcoaceticus/baumannii complex]QWZ59282.1 AraC family transcriptional regulator [Acinetobacter pittii]